MRFASNWIHGGEQLDFRGMKIGEIIRQKVREDGRTAKEICDLVGMTRGNLDKIYHKDSVATDLLAAFCEVLKYDFFVHVSPYRAQSNTRYFTAEEENVPFGAEGQGASQNVSVHWSARSGTWSGTLST